MTAGATIVAFAGYGMIGFQPLFIQYAKGFSPGDTALIFMFVFVCSEQSALFCGYPTCRHEILSDRSLPGSGIGLSFAAPCRRMPISLVI